MIRIFDIFFSFMGIIFLSPLFILLWFIGLLDNGSPLFMQKRLGQNLKSFVLIKFRTMPIETKTVGTHLTKNIELTTYGYFLRRTKLDEIPQLLNVLFGDMSLIGPRPLTAVAFNSYSLEIQNLLKTIKPGLSGIGSIVFREEERILSLVNDPKKFHLTIISSYKGELEKWYVINKNLFIYFNLIFLTAIVIFFPNTRVVSKFFKNIPTPPEELKKYLK